MLLVISGVSGAGKTTIGKMLSKQLAVPFFDADDFHLPSNVEKMANGIPRDDADRQPWLETLEIPDYGWHIDIDRSLEEVVENILERLHDA